MIFKRIWPDTILNELLLFKSFSFTSLYESRGCFSSKYLFLNLKCEGNNSVLVYDLGETALITWQLLQIVVCSYCFHRVIFNCGRLFGNDHAFLDGPGITEEYAIKVANCGKCWTGGCVGLTVVMLYSVYYCWFTIAGRWYLKSVFFFMIQYFCLVMALFCFG